MTFSIAHMLACCDQREATWATTPSSITAEKKREEEEEEKKRYHMCLIIGTNDVRWKWQASQPGDLEDGKALWGFG
jgi:hypothetical protein